MMSNFKVWDTVTIVEWWTIRPWSTWFWFVWTKHKITSIRSAHNYCIILDIPWRWKVGFKESEVSLIDNNVFYKSLMYDDV